MSVTAEQDGRGRVKLVYICGYGRSGTTLLDIFLGQDEAVFGAGEVSTLARHVWGNDEYCACGSPVRECPYWSEVVGSWREGEEVDSLARLRDEEEKIEGLFSFSRIFGGASFNHYARRTSKLLGLMSEVSGRPILVDSSKMPGRGFALSRLPSVDLHVVHVVRDGRGVAWSLMKPYKRDVASGLQKEIRPKSWFYTALRWTVVNLATELLCRKVGKAKSIRVRYEDFVSDPEGVVGRIIGMANGTSERRAQGDIRPGHQVAGNRLRMQSSIRVKKDEAWRRQMPAYKQAAFSIFCAPLLWRYGYRLSSELTAEPEPALSS